MTAAGSGSDATPTTSGAGGASGVDAGSDSVDGADGTPAMPAAGSGAADTASSVLVPDPSWDCGMPEGIPPPEQGELVFETTLALDEILDVGMTPYGQRQVTHSSGGSIEGTRLGGSFLEGGIGYDLTLSNGARELEEVHVLRAADGTPLYLRACGVATGPEDTRMVAHFEAATSGAYGWLNDATLVGTRTLDPTAKTIKMVFYEHKDAPQGERVTITEPADALAQWTWECKTGSSTRGPILVEEDVLIGGSIAVGAIPGGTRNIIPITGGTFMGERGMGEIIPGGADFQLSGGAGFILDARYTLRASDGTLIIVRNCGATDALIPVLETAMDSPHAWVNDAKFVSSVGVGVGRVYITLYDAS